MNGLNIDSLKMLAVALTGLTTGSLLFVSVVDVPLLLDLKNDEITTKRVFQSWWPGGRRLMGPLILGSSLSHAVTYAYTRDNNWLVAGVLIASILPYTIVVMGGSIGKIRDSSSTDVVPAVQRFCQLHHPRLLIAGLAFAVSLRLLDVQKL